MGDQPKAWFIYFVPNCSYTRPQPKDKLVIIVCRDQYPWGFLINSEIDPWIQIHPEMLACQAHVKATEHPCLAYDSYVDCIDLFRFDDFELTNVRDEVSKKAKKSILEAVGVSKTISRGHKRLILS